MLQIQLDKYFILGFLLLSFQLSGQELGFIKRGNHFLQINKTITDFNLVYSDVSTQIKNKKGVINFPNKNSIYNVIMNGFKRNNNHQILIQTKADTIIRLNYIKLRGIKLLSISQNNLSSKTKSRSNYFTIEDIKKLFGTP